MANRSKSKLSARIEALEAVVARAWGVLGVDPAEATDDPDTADLADSIRTSLQHERDKTEETRVQLNIEHAEVCEDLERQLIQAREQIATLTRRVTALETALIETKRFATDALKGSP